MYKRIGLALISAVLLTVLLGSPVVAQSEAQAVVHTVMWGQTLTSVARQYGVTVEALMEANNLNNPNYIFAGQRLQIPLPAEDVTIHTVMPGESLLTISAKYGATLREIAVRNNLWNWNLVYVGQRLIIPGKGPEAPTKPPVALEDSEATLPEIQEEIIISSPQHNDAVSTPITIKGWGSGFEQTLAVDILDETGNVIGQGFAIIEGKPGEQGLFTGTVEYIPPASAQVGRVQVYSISPRDGAIEHLASVTVNLQP